MPIKPPKRNKPSPAIIALNAFMIIIILGLIYAIYQYLIINDSTESFNNKVLNPDISVEATSSSSIKELQITTNSSSDLSSLSTKDKTKETTNTKENISAIEDIDTVQISEIPTTVIKSTTISKTSEPIPSTTSFAHSSTPNYDFIANDLFIGDSISTGFYLYEYLPKSSVFAKVGLNPESALYESIDGQTIKEKITHSSPDKIYIMLGSNGIAYLSAEYMAAQIKILVETLKELSPGSTIYILTIPPVSEYRHNNHPEKIDNINKYNSKLIEIATAIEVEIIDIYEILKNQNGFLDSEYSEKDGLHFKPAAYVKVLEVIQETAY